MAAEPCGSKAARACWPQRGVQNQGGVGGLDGFCKSAERHFTPSTKRCGTRTSPCSESAHVQRVCAWSASARCARTTDGTIAICCFVTVTGSSKVAKSQPKPHTTRQNHEPQTTKPHATSHQPRGTPNTPQGKPSQTEPHQAEPSHLQTSTRWFSSQSS